MSRVTYLTSGIDKTLFDSILVVAISLILVLRSPGTFMRFPLTMSHTRYGSDFSGKKSAHILAYVIILSDEICLILSWSK